MSRGYEIGDKAVDKQSMRMGTVVDLVEEFDDSGNTTYHAAKIDFGNGTVDWISGDNVTSLLMETEGD